LAPPFLKVDFFKSGIYRRMKNFKYLFIGLLILLLIGLFGNIKRNKASKEEQPKTTPTTSTTTSSKTVIVANGQPAPKKYGYVPPPAYNPYKNQYYNN
jgi:hypothetical protein